MAASYDYQERENVEIDKRWNPPPKYPKTIRNEVKHRTKVNKYVDAVLHGSELVDGSDDDTDVDWLYKRVMPVLGAV
eukprot:3702605-Amphidinium_carterae.1